MYKRTEISCGSISIFHSQVLDIREFLMKIQK
jgi:hypothetical protein